MKNPRRMPAGSEGLKCYICDMETGMASARRSEIRIIELEYKQIELKKELSRAKIRKVMVSANCNCWLCEE